MAPTQTATPPARNPVRRHHRLISRAAERLWSAHPALLFLAMVVVTLTVAGLAVQYLPMNPAGSWRAFATNPWLDGLSRWDAGWFRSIASGGYWFEPGRQSPVAFYPLFPLLMRALAWVVGDYDIAGIAIAMSAGFAGVLLFDRWTGDRLGHQPARMSLWVLLLFPFSVYLFGAMYSDALFVCSTLAAFICLDKNRPSLAGLFGAAATATRPVGLAVVVGLAVRAAERRGVFGAPGRRGLHTERLRATDAGVLLSLAGLGGYWIFLWYRFGDPFAWVHAAAAPGWYVEPGPANWFKVVFFRDLLNARWDLSNGIRAVHASVCLIAYATIPAVWRRFGIGYAVYAFLVLSIPAVSSPDFFGMGRYALPAFPCFAIVGAFLHQRPGLARACLAAGFLGQLAVTALYAAWYPAS